MKRLILTTFIASFTILSSCKKEDKLPAPKLAESVVTYVGNMYYQEGSIKDNYQRTVIIKDNKYMYDYFYNGSIDTLQPGNEPGIDFTFDDENGKGYGFVQEYNGGSNKVIFAKSRIATRNFVSKL